MLKLNSEQIYSSKYLVEQINFFRKEENNKVEILHSDLLKKIEKEFKEDIGEGNISLTSYIDASNRQSKMYSLVFEQALQILMSESRTVRKKCIEVMKNQQKEIEELKIVNVPKTYKEALLALVEAEEEKEKLILEKENLKQVVDSSTDWVSILKVAKHNLIHENNFNWRILKSKSEQLGYVVKRVQSVRFDFQNIYHVNVFKACYPQYNYNFIENSNSKFLLL